MYERNLVMQKNFTIELSIFVSVGRIGIAVHSVGSISASSSSSSLSLVLSLSFPFSLFLSPSLHRSQQRSFRFVDETGA